MSSRVPVQTELDAGHSLVIDNNARTHLRSHVSTLVLSAPTAGLLDVGEEDRAHHYLDTLITLLFDTLAEDDPWRELFGVEDRTIDGARFGLLEAFDDILSGESVVRRAIRDFGEVKRDATTVDEKNRLVAWLSMRHRIIAMRSGSLDNVASIAEQASRMASGVDSNFSRRQLVALHKITDDEYLIARENV